MSENKGYINKSKTDSWGTPQCILDEVLKDAKEKRFFEKPSEKKQRKKKEAVRRWRKLQKKLELLD